LFNSVKIALENGGKNLPPSSYIIGIDGNLR